MCGKGNAAGWFARSASSAVPKKSNSKSSPTTSGAPVYVRDVAEVRLGYKKPSGFVRRFGADTIAVNVVRDTGANVLEVMNGLRQETEKLNDGCCEPAGWC